MQRKIQLLMIILYASPCIFTIFLYNHFDTKKNDHKFFLKLAEKPAKQ